MTYQIYWLNAPRSYVAIVDSRVVDADENRTALAERMDTYTEG